MQPATVTILLPQGRGHYRTHYFSVTQDEDDAKILARLSALSPTSLDPIEQGERALRAMTMSRLFVGKAKLPKVHDMEAQTVSAAYVRIIEKDEMITNLLRGSPVLYRGTGNVFAHLVDGTTGQDDASSIVAWCFYYKLDGTAAAFWLLFALVLAIVVGASVGFGSSDGKLGLGVGGGLLAVLTAVQVAIIMWKTY
ncbi:hypothetical protein HBI25_015220 [Parastagonospora nodorum]|nr:hypothetical protein HBH53_018860 [Parastagonospora nodorum]KAH3965368.1 hypothetical protein HBH51_152930 [Parastagonospora nodorum]KAH3977303.1 hypothetical protein HBH52_113260 [Parastagonospora nodorum]KAH3999869.1 hypothetical protein HBI10_108490 [Parastagonospora nodorum]KAH4022288.1 hypothetical protein HBI13_100690 [Parastagonospora nodorum]